MRPTHSIALVPMRQGRLAAASSSRLRSARWPTSPPSRWKAVRPRRAPRPTFCRPPPRLRVAMGPSAPSSTSPPPHRSGGRLRASRSSNRPHSRRLHSRSSDTWAPLRALVHCRQILRCTHSHSNRSDRHNNSGRRVGETPCGFLHEQRKREHCHVDRNLSAAERIVQPTLTSILESNRYISIIVSNYRLQQSYPGQQHASCTRACAGRLRTRPDPERSRTVGVRSRDWIRIVERRNSKHVKKKQDKS